MIRDVHLDFLPIPDPGVKKTPDPGSGSASLVSPTPHPSVSAIATYKKR
jgi:hypothetical protein